MIVYIFISFVVSIVMMTSLAIIVLHVMSLTFRRGQLVMRTFFFQKFFALQFCLQIRLSLSVFCKRISTHKRHFVNNKSLINYA